jgi:hypothetical protein
MLHKIFLLGIHSKPLIALSKHESILDLPDKLNIKISILKIHGHLIGFSQAIPEKDKILIKMYLEEKVNGCQMYLTNKMQIY